MSQPSPAQMQALLQYASQKLGVPAEQLASTVSNGGYEALTASLSESSRRTLEQLVSNPSQLQALLSNDQVKQLLKQFSK